MNKWDTRMLRVAKEVSSWSKDENRKVGCVITSMSYDIISTGYNGYPRFVSDEDKKGKLFKSVHAEVNAALRLPGVSGVYRAFIYGGHPCAQCAATLLQAGCDYFVVPGIPQNSKWVDSMEAAKELIRQRGMYVNYMDIEIYKPRENRIISMENGSSLKF